MSLSAILANLGLIAVAIGTLAFLKYTGVLEIIIQGFDWVKYFVSWLLENRIFAMLFFIFLIAIASTLITFVLGLNYACDASNNLREQKYGVVGGFAMFMTGINANLNVSNPNTYNKFIADWTSPTQKVSSTSERGILNVNCVTYDPKLMLFGRLDFLNFRYWILIMLIAGLIGVIGFIKR